MRAFDSIAKKMAIPMVVLFEIGWLVFTGGLGAILHEINRELQDSTTQNADDVLNTPVLFPHYFTLVAGQFVAALFLLHAALPSSVVGTIVGVLSSVLNIIFFVSVGYLIHTTVPLVLASEESVRNLQELSSLSSSSSEYLTSALLYLHSDRCMLGGAIIMTLSWGVVQLLVFFYECRVGPDRESSLWQNKRNLWRVIRECADSLSTSISQEFKASPGELLRLCTIPLLVLSAVGWSVSVAGLYKISDIAASSRSGSSSLSPFQYDFATCVIFFVAPLLYLTSFLHAGCSGGASTMSGVFSSILNTFLVVNMGYKLVDISRIKYTQSQAPTSSYGYYSDTYISDTERAIRHNQSLILGGGVVCLFFWMIICAAWHFYRVKGSRAHVRLEESTAGPGMVGDQPQDVAHVPVQQYACNTSFVPQQVPPYTKPVGVEMQPVANIN